MQRGLRFAIGRTTALGRSGCATTLMGTKMNKLSSSSSSALSNEMRRKGILHTARAALLMEATSLRVMGLISGPEENLIRGWDAGVDADDDGG